MILKVIVEWMLVLIALRAAVDIIPLMSCCSSIFQKNLTYLELMNKCEIDEKSGLMFLVLTRKDINVKSLLNAGKRRSRADITYVLSSY